METVVNPFILFLDEPTSGLDTFTAYRVIECLYTLSKQGRTIVSTIHQPSSECFYLFDDLILLLAGEIVYCGPVLNVVEYFSKIGYSCPTFNHPADYIFMKILNHKSILSSDDIIYQEKQNFLVVCWKNSSLYAELQNELKFISQRENRLQKDLHSDILFHHRYHVSIATEMKFLIVRAWKNLVRNKLAFNVKLLQSVMIGLAVGLIFQNISSRPFQAQIQVYLPKNKLNFYALYNFRIDKDHSIL